MEPVTALVTALFFGAGIACGIVLEIIRANAAYVEYK
jgi:hypothetical protein